MTNVAIPGSFDPITQGHLNIIQRCANLFDQVHVLVMTNTSKKNLFTLDERVELVAGEVATLKNVTVHGFADQLTVDILQQLDIQLMVRGIRSASDAEFERQIAGLNHQLDPQIETLFMPAEPEFSVIASSMVKEIVRFGGDASGMLSSRVLQAVRAKYAQK